MLLTDMRKALFTHPVLIEAQNGFGKNKPANTAGQTITESMQEALNRGLHAIGLFFDLSKHMI
jgi:hypothetical protein